MPMVSHAETDVATFRMITSQFCVSGHVKQSDIIRAFGVTPIKCQAVGEDLPREGRA